MSYNFRLRPITPRTKEAKEAREQALAEMHKRLEDERRFAAHSLARAPVTPRSGESKARYSAYLKESIARSENLVRAENLARGQSGQNQECSGQGCIGKLKSGLSRISKAVGLSGGRKARRTHRKIRRSGRKTRHSRR
jgi:hypothetical protein